MHRVLCETEHLEVRNGLISIRSSDGSRKEERSPRRARAGGR